MGSAMRKPRIQPGKGSAQADSMIDGRTTLTGTLPRFSREGLLGEGLGVGVGVGPAEGEGAGAAGLDHALLDPRESPRLGLGGDERGARRPELATGLVAELLEHGGGAALGVGVGADAARRGDLGLPVEVVEPEGAGVDRRLGGAAAPVAGDVAGRHRDEVRRDVELVARLRQAGGAEEVDLDGEVEGGVERHRGGGVDDGVAAGEDRPSGLVEPEPVGADVAGHHLNAAGDHLVEGRLAAELLAEPVEAVVLEDLALGALLDGAHAAGPDEEHELAVGGRSQQALDQSGAHEAGGAGDEDALAGKVVPDHAGSVAHSLYQMVDALGRLVAWR